MTALAPVSSYGVERVPLSGGAVLAANHFSAFDHPLLAAVFPRPIFFASKAELIAVPLVGEALARTGAFPVRRGEPDRAALRHARSLARAGRVVGVHLEGTRQRSGRPGAFKAGAVAIALGAAVPVIPCGLATDGWTLRRRPRAAIVFGAPVAFDGLPVGRRGYAEALAVVGDAVVRLWEQAVEARERGFPPRLKDGAERGDWIRRRDHRADELTGA